jgi:hypothetical protein
MAFPKPRWMRVLFVFSSLAALGVPCIVWMVFLQGQVVNSGCCAFGLLFFVCLSGLSFWFSGPDDVCFDTERKTYYLVKGSPFSAKTRTGPLSDLWGVYVGRTQGRCRYFCVGVTWWGGKGSVTLERFNNKASAERFAAMLMSNLELKQVMPPRNLRPLA